MNRKCKKCEKEKIINEYYYTGKVKNTRSWTCKECCKAGVMANRVQKKEYYKEYEKKRANLPHRVKAREEYAKTGSYKESATRSNKRYRQENPKKYKAHNMVNNAIRDGKILKPKGCEKCGSNKKLNGHHDDYNYPLSIRWLCYICHTDWHKENGEGLNAT